MAAEATREVNFRLKVTSDPSIGQQFNTLEQRVAELQKRMSLRLTVTEQIRRGSNGNGPAASTPAAPYQAPSARTPAAPYRSATDAAVERHRQQQAMRPGWQQLSAQGRTAMGNRTAWSAGQQRMEQERRQAEEDEARALERRRLAANKQLAGLVKGGPEAVEQDERRTAREEAAANRDIKRFERQADRDEGAERRRLEREAKERAAADRDIKRFQAQAEKAEAADEERRRRAGNRQLAQLVRSGPQAVAQDERRAEQDRRRQEQAEQRQRREAEQGLARQRESYQRLGESIGSTVDATTRLAEGMAYLGLIGRRDLGNLTDSLLAVRGTVETIRGAVGTMRDIGGLARNLREVRDIGGIGGIGRSMVGLGPRATGAGAMATGAAVRTATQLAGGTAGTAGVPVAAISAASLAVAAAIGKAALEIREATFTGFGNAPRTGSVVSNYATATVGLGARLAGSEMAVQRVVSNARGPVGEQSRDAELRAEREAQARMEKHRKVRSYYEWIPLVGRYAAYAQASEETAFYNSQTERKARFAEEDRLKRQQVLEGHERGNEEINQNAAMRLQTRREQHAIQFRSRERIDESARPYEVIAYRQRVLNLQRQEFGANRGALQDRIREVNEQISQMPGGQVSPEAIRAREQLQREIIEMRRQELSLAQQQRQIDIDGAKQRLGLIKEQITSARQQVTGARERQQSFFERFGEMTPMQQRAIANAKAAAMRGEQLNRYQLDTLRDADEQGQQARSDYLMNKGRRDAERFGVGQMEQQEVVNAQGVEEFERQRGIEQTRLGEGARISAAVDNKVEISVTMESGIERVLQDALAEAMEPFTHDLRERTEEWKSEARDYVQQQIAEAMARQNGSRAQGARGGGAG